VDLYKTIRVLHEERERLDRLIASLEELKTTGAVEPKPRRRGRKGMSAEERRQVSERMRNYWAQRRTAPHGQAVAAVASTGGPAEPSAG
jgi:hypothetical protein